MVLLIPYLFSAILFEMSTAHWQEPTAINFTWTPPKSPSGYIASEGYKTKDYDLIFAKSTSEGIED